MKVDKGYLPLFTLMGNFKAILDNWIATVDTGEPQLKITIKGEKKEEIDWTKIGHKQIQRDGSATWLVFGIEFSSDETEEIRDVLSEKFSLSIEYHGYGVFDIEPGKWFK